MKAEIRLLVPDLTKLFFFSDGGPNHFKNRFNFAIFFTDFGLLVEWHFWDSGHEKKVVMALEQQLKDL